MPVRLEESKEETSQLLNQLRPLLQMLASVLAPTALNRLARRGGMILPVVYALRIIVYFHPSGGVSLLKKRQRPGERSYWK